MLHRVALVRTDVSEERIVSIIRARIGELEITLAVTSNRCTLRRNTVPDFAGREVWRGQFNGFPRPLISILQTEAAAFSFK
jgi:hypothetical protein